MNKRALYISYGVLFIVFWILYFKVIFYKPFIYDDPELILENTVLQQKKWKEMFMQGFLGNYMPVFMIFITLLYHIKGNIMFIHLASLLLHLLNGGLLVYIFKKLKASDWVTFLSIAFFLLHPVQTESTCWASEARTTLGNFFLLAALAVSGGEAFGLRQLVFSNALFLLALLSKPTGVIYPLLFFFVRMGKPSRWLYPNVVATLIVSLAFSVFTYFIQKEQGFVQESKYLPYAYRIPHAFFIYARYAWNTFLPFWLSILYPYSKYLKWMLLGGAALMLMIPYAWWKIRTFNPVAFLLLSLSAVVMLPVLQVVTFGQVPIADRYAYLFVPFFTGAVFTLTEKYLNDLVKYGLLVGWIILLSVLAWQRIHLWSDSLLILQDGDKKYPRSHIIYSSLGVEYMRRNLDELAEKYLTEAVNIAPLSPDLRYNLALYYIKKNRAESARNLLEYSIRNLAFHRKTYVLMAEFYNQDGKYEKALDLVSRSLKANPNQPRAWYVTGNALSGLNRLDESIRAYQKAIELMPTVPDFHFRLGIVLCKKKEYEQGIISMNRAISLNGSVGEFYYWRGEALKAIGKDPCPDYLKGAALRYPPAENLIRSGLCNRN
jgi:tetratricopeptide (TPR) repeat protein